MSSPITFSIIILLRLICQTRFFLLIRIPHIFEIF
jgi:hypothetical protein